MNKKVFIFLLLATALVGVFAFNRVEAASDVSVEVADRYGFAAATLDDGVIVQYIGDLSETYGAAGSGIFDSFVRLQGNDKRTDIEKGYNTDGTREWDTKAGNFTHSILLSEIPTIQINDVLYWEFFADINDSDSTPKISLDDFELYLTDDPNLTGYPFVGNATEIYDYSDANNGFFILINDVNQGSGRGDLRYLVPVSDTGVDHCSYGDLACTTYLVLYSVWGGKGGEYLFDGGFEEWKVKKYPVLQVSKDISGTYDTPVSWEIVKEFDGSYDLFAGESVVHEYEVSVDPIFGDPKNIMVYGTITVLGDEKTSVDATLMDKFNGIEATLTSCSVPKNEDGTYTIASGGTVTCSYELDLAGVPVDGTNLARANYEIDGAVLAFQGSAEILAGDYVETLTGYPDITVDDDNLEDESWSASAVYAAWTYSQEFSCPTNLDEYTDGYYSKDFVNTATIVQTGQSDIATVTLNCYALDVTKSADEFYSRYFEWDITKSVSPASWDLFLGESGTSEYTVNLIQTGSYENDWQVTGEIRIDNPHPSSDADLTLVLDDAGGIPGTVDCPDMVVPAGGTLTCSYETAVQDAVDANPFGDTNTATATQQLYDFGLNGSPIADGTLTYSDDHPIDFSEATVNLVDEEATVSDSVAGPLGTFSGSQEITYARDFACDSDDGKHDNVASFVTNDRGLSGEDDASVMVNCYDLEVGKTANESFTRTYQWMIDKVVNNPGPITLQRGESIDVTYEVLVDLAGDPGYIDSDFAVAGTITVINNHPSRDAVLTTLVDQVSDYDAVTVNCDSLVVPAGSSMDCSYASSLPDAASRTNTATATQQLYDYDKNIVATADGTMDYKGAAPVDFGDALISLIDETIDVNDSMVGFLGTVSYLEAPKTFSYPYTITAGDNFCGSYVVDNTADFVTVDTGATGSDDASVVIEVPCEGCTPGFWQGGAGEVLWDEEDDPDWTGEGTNPFTHDTLFNDFFSEITDPRLDGFTMIHLVSSGGGSDPAVKAARDMVAAYLNEVAFPATFPSDSLDALVEAWYAAVEGGDTGLSEFHGTVSGWNDPPDQGYCPLP